MTPKDGRISEVAKRFTERGFATLILDYRGLCRSEGKRRLFPLEQAEDIRNAITFLSLQAGVDGTRIGLYGSSFGGAHVVYVGGTDSRVKCVVCIGAIADGEDWLRKLRRQWEWRDLWERVKRDRDSRVLNGVGEMVDPLEIMLPDPETGREFPAMYQNFPAAAGDMPLASVEMIAAYKPFKVADALPPILVGHGEADDLVPVEHAYLIYGGAREPKRLMIFKGASHFQAYGAPHFDSFFESAVDWFGTYLSEQRP